MLPKILTGRIKESRMKLLDKIKFLAKTEDDLTKVKPVVKPIIVADSDRFTYNGNEHLGDTTLGIYEKVKEMEDSDPHLYGIIQTRILALLSLKSEITGEGAEADFVREVFENIPSFNSTSYQTLHSAFTCGHGVENIVFSEKDLKWVISARDNHAIKYFDFSEKNELRRTDVDGDPVPLKELYYPVLTFRKRNNNRYGESLFQKLYWYWYIKRESVQFWALFTEKNVAPSIIGTYEDVKHKEKIDLFIKNIRNQSSASVPKGVILEVLNKIGTGAVDSYEKFVSYMDKKMSIAVLGQNLTTESDNRSGSYAQAVVHSDTFYNMIKADIVWYREFINFLIIRPLVDLNFPNVKKYPEYNIAQTKEVDKKVMSEALDILVNRLKFKGVTEEYIHKTFGIPTPTDGQTVIIPTEAEPNKFTEQLSDDRKLYLTALKEVR